MFFLLIYIFCGRGLNGRAGCRQTDGQTDKQTNRRILEPPPMKLANIIEKAVEFRVASNIWM